MNSCRCFSLFNEQQRPPVTGRTNLQSLCPLQSRLLIHTQLFRFPTKLQWFSPSEQLLDTRLVRIEFFPAGDFQRTDWTCLFSLDRFVPRCYFERYWSRKIIPFLSYVRLSCVWFIATHFKSRRPKTILTIYKTWSAILLLVSPLDCYSNNLFPPAIGDCPLPNLRTGSN